MDYNQKLNLISSSIFDLAQSDFSALNGLVSDDTLAMVKVYQKNLYGLIYKILENDFSVTKKYLGEDNFIFFIRLYIQDENIKSPNLQIVSRQFSSFIEKSYNIHQDDILGDLAKIDCLWSSSKKSEIAVSEGMTQFWLNFSENLKTSHLTINLEKAELVKIAFNGKEKQMIYSKAT